MIPASPVYPIARTALWSAVLRVIGTAAALLVGIQLARYLGPAGLGYYALAVAIVMPLASIAQFGLPTLAVRELAVGSERRDGRRVRAVAFRFTMITLALSGFMILVIVAAVRLFLPVSNSGSALLARASMLPVVALVALFGAQLRGLNHPLRGQSLEIVARPLLMSLLLFLAAETAGTVTPELALLLTAASFGAVAALGLNWLHRALPAPSGPTHRKGELRGWLKAAGPLSIADLLRQVDGVYAVLVVGLLATADETGIFRVAASMVIVVAIPNSIMHVLMAPDLARLYARGDRAALQAALSASARIMSAALGAGVIAVILFGEWLLEILFGAQFVPAWQSLIVLTVAHLAGSFFCLSGVFLAMSGRETSLAKIQCIATAAGIAAAFPLVEWFGAVGAAWSVVIGFLASGALTWLKIRRQTGLDCSMIGLPPSRPG